MEAAETVGDAVRLLQSEGFNAEFDLGAAGLRCTACGRAHPVESLVQVRMFRFEGDSDPADEAIVLGLECPECGERGIVVSAFGPEADPVLFEALNRLIR